MQYKYLFTDVFLWCRYTSVVFSWCELAQQYIQMSFFITVSKNHHKMKNNFGTFVVFSSLHNWLNNEWRVSFLY